MCTNVRQNLDSSMQNSKQNVSLVSYNKSILHLSCLMNESVRPAKTQISQSLHWGHVPFCWFVTRQLICSPLLLNLLKSIRNSVKDSQQSLASYFFCDLFNEFSNTWALIHKILCFCSLFHFLVNLQNCDFSSHLLLLLYHSDIDYLFLNLLA